MGEITGRRAVIIGSAPMGNFSNLRRYLQADDFVCCADGGRNTALRLGLTPGWYVGDDDSGGSPDGLPSVTLPCEKNFTDLEAAIYHALEAGFRELLLTGCTGGRADHYLANLFLMEEIVRKGASALMVDDINEIRFLLPGSYEIENRPSYRYLSLLPLDEVLSGVCITGCKYPLSSFTLPRCSSRGVSNEILPGCRACVSFEQGRTLLVRSDPT